MTICVLYQNVLLLSLNLGKNLFFACNYRSPCQTLDEFENNYQKFQLILPNLEDTSLASLTFSAGYTQLINKLTQFFSGGSSCIDIISCNKPKSLKNLANAESTILFFKHAIMTLFLQRSVIIFPFPQIKVEKFGTTKNANDEGTQNSISLCKWEKAFENLSINEKVGLLEGTLIQI